MDRYGRFDNSNSDTLRHLFKSAQARVARGDSPGASETVRNAYVTLAKSIPGIELSKLQLLAGTELDVYRLLDEGRPRTAIRVLKFIQTQLIYGKFQFQKSA